MLTLLLTSLLRLASPEVEGEKPPAPVVPKTLVVFQSSQEIELLNTKKVQVFGLRRELRMEDGKPLGETRCDPCTWAVEEWAPHPEGEEIAAFSWSTEAEHAQVELSIKTMQAHFETAPREGSERDGRHVLLFAVLDPKKAVGPRPVTRLDLVVDGVATDRFELPRERKSVVVEARPFRANDTGALEPVTPPAVSWRLPCGIAKPLSPGKVEVSLTPGMAGCALEATASPGAFAAKLALDRAVKLQLLVDGQPADAIDLGQAVIELVAEAKVGDVAVPFTPRWKSDAGTFSIAKDGKSAKLRVDGKQKLVHVRLEDAATGAFDELELRVAF